ncbi:ABC transporter substrate-binding protein [Vibrio alfacsensis]|uniref:ABC transporter substrate-binding protein n=1 Tax=Vibrio TaxID=662 RepID=UPI0040698956
MFRKYCLLAGALLSLCTPGFAKPLRIQTGIDQSKLAINLLTEAVHRSPIYSELEYAYGDEPEPATNKLVADVQSGALDIVWLGTTSDYEQQMTALYFPIYRGLLGMRIALVEQDKKDILAKVNRFSEMKNYTPCQGKIWSDTFILEENGILVAKSMKYHNLFAMLEADRCHYFPRGTFEAYAEAQRYPEYNLAVDKHVLFRYKMPYYFFVNRENQALAQHLSAIFDDMIDDGTFAKLFFANPEVSNALNQAKLGQRTIFELQNSDLSTKTQSLPERFWFNPLTDSY